MQMVATARFKRAFGQCVSAREYINGIDKLADNLTVQSASNLLRHPLLRKQSKTHPQILLVLTSDRGLCGGYNTAILKLASGRLAELRQDEREVQLHVAGKRGITQLLHEGHQLAETYVEPDGSGEGWFWVSQLAEGFMSDFLAKDICCVEIVCTRLIGARSYRPSIVTLLPIEFREHKAEQDPPDSETEKYDFVPSAEVVFGRLLPMMVRLRLFQCFMEGSVTEQIARMTAMQSASENAEEMIHNLTLRYNRMRQGQITTELAEILGGSMTLK